MERIFTIDEALEIPTDELPGDVWEREDEWEMLAVLEAYSEVHAKLQEQLIDRLQTLNQLRNGNEPEIESEEYYPEWRN